MGRVWLRAPFACLPPFPVPSCGVGVHAGPGSRLCPALLGWVVGVCFLRFFFLALWCRLLGVPVPGLPVCPPIPFLSGWAAGFFFFVVCVCMFRCPFSRWAAVPGLVLPVLPGWPPCASSGVLSSVPSGWGVWPPFVLLAGNLVAVGCFRAPHPPLFFFGGGGPACSSLCPPWAGARTVAGVWYGWSLATPGGGSCVLLPATPGWVSLPVVAGVPRHSWLRVPGAVPRHSWVGSAGGGGVWCAAVVCWWGFGWCVVWLVSRHSWRRFLCATYRHSWPGFAAGGGARSSPLLAEGPRCGSPPLLAGVRWRRWCVGGVVAGVWCGWSLATPGGGSCVLLPATPGWVSLPVVMGVPRHSWRRVPGAVPRHSWLGFAVGGGVWRVVCGVWCAAVVCWWGCGWCVVWLIPRHSWRRFLCATPRHSWLGFAARGGARSSPLLAEGPGRGSPPFLAGVRWRRWCVVCGVWRLCVGGVVAGVWCGWSLATPGGGSCVLLPATPGWVLLPVVVGVPCHS